MSDNPFWCNSCKTIYPDKCTCKQAATSQPAGQPNGQPYGWQPIETAPRDGSRILLKGEILADRDERGNVIWVDTAMIGSWYHTGCWERECGGLNSMYEPDQSAYRFWMPLPA